MLFVIIIDYIRNPHLKLMSTRCFASMLICALINLVLDIGTVYTITHPDIVPDALNRLMHQLFIASVILLMFFIYLYVKILARNQIRLKKLEWVMACIPLVISAVFIIFGKLDYYRSYNAAYSYGPMVYTVFVCAFLYLVAIFAAFFGKKAMFTKYQRISIQVGIVIWICGLVVQMKFPPLLLSGICFSLLVLCVYFSFENQRENFDSEAECFNRAAFSRQLSEYYEGQKQLFLVNIAVENYERISSLTGHAASTDVILKIRDIAASVVKKPLFHSRTNIISFFETAEISSQMLDELTAAFENASIHDIAIKCRIIVMDLKKYTSNTDEVHELISFMRSYCKNAENTVCCLDEEIVSKKLRHDKIARLVGDAVENDGFEMVYQPIYNTETESYKSAEALIRIKSIDELGFVSPEEFIPIAEEQGLIMEIGDCVLSMVCEFAHRERLSEKGLSYIEINLSGIQALSPNINERIRKITERYNISPSFINLEITETASLDSGDVFLENIHKLKSSGFSFSMDDFGTGYSNLAQMNRMHYDLVKIDKSLLWDAFGEKNDDTAKNLLYSVICMIKSMGAEIVAEGVETKDMADYLAENKVEYLQGYYFSKPVKEDEFLKIITANS